MSITHLLATYLTDFISALGYPGVTILMAMESMIFPVPSEAVMPFAGFLIYEGKMNWISVLIASSLGSFIGSYLSYIIGQKGGRPFIEKYGKYFLLNHHDLEITEKFFKKYGERTIFISRFIPIIRHLISLPAGIGEMNKKKFLIYTLIGATMWNMFLAWVGFYFGAQWERAESYKKYIDPIFLGLVILLIGFFVYKKLKSRRK